MGADKRPPSMAAPPVMDGMTPLRHVDLQVPHRASHLHLAGYTWSARENRLERSWQVLRGASSLECPRQSMSQPCVSTRIMLCQPHARLPRGNPTKHRPLLCC